MKWKAIPWIFVAALLGLAFYAHLTQERKPLAETHNLVCAQPAQGCAFSLDGRPGKITFSRAPRAMEGFTLTVLAPGAKSVAVDFQMPDMDMGENHYVLKQVRAGEFSADNVTLPVCAHGGVDWVADFNVDGAHYTLPFTVR